MCSPRSAICWESILWWCKEVGKPHIIDKELSLNVIHKRVVDTSERSIWFLLQFYSLQLQPVTAPVSPPFCSPYIFDHDPEPVSYSLSNFLNRHALIYLARSIASNQAYSQLLSRFHNTTFNPLPSGIVIARPVVGRSTTAALQWLHSG